MKKIIYCLLVPFFFAVTADAVAKEGQLSKKTIKILQDKPASKQLGCKDFKASFPEDITSNRKYQAELPVLGVDKLLEDGKLYCDVSTSPVASEPARIYLDESGSINGVPVVINHSSATAGVGSGGVFENTAWDIGCKKDDFNDTKSCYVRQYGMTIIKSNGVYSVYVGHDLEPGSLVELRINKTPEIVSSSPVGLLSKSDGDDFLKLATKDSHVIVRYKVISKENPEVLTIDTSTLGAAIVALTKIENNFK